MYHKLNKRFLKTMGKIDREIEKLQEWKLCELGRSSAFPRGYAGTSQQRRGPVDNAEEVGLIDSTRSLGKLSTWGSDQQCCDGLGTYRTNTRRLE